MKSENQFLGGSGHTWWVIVGGEEVAKWGGVRPDVGARVRRWGARRPPAGGNPREARGCGEKQERAEPK